MFTSRQLLQHIVQRLQLRRPKIALCRMAASGAVVPSRRRDRTLTSLAGHGSSSCGRRGRLPTTHGAMRATTVSLACRRALAPCAVPWARATGAPGAPARPARGWAAAAAAAAQPGGGGAAAAPTPTPKQQHAALQADYFDREIEALQASITPEVDAKLARIAAAIPGLSAASRVLDAGAGEGALIPHLQVR